MSGSSRKLLITGGCSNTDDKWSGYIKNNITTWPNILAKELDCDLINTGFFGASNDSIASKVDKTLLKYKDLDPIVCILWSDPCRINFFDFDNLQTIPDRDHLDMQLNVSDREPERYEYHKLQHQLELLFADYFTNFATLMKWDLTVLDKLIVDFSLRTILSCKRNYGAHSIMGLSLVSNIPKSYPLKTDNEDYKKRLEILCGHLKDHEIIRELGTPEMEWKFGWCNRFRQQQGYLLDDGHPNQKGHFMIAEEFMEKIYLSEAEVKPMRFIYE